MKQMQGCHGTHLGLGLLLGPLFAPELDFDRRGPQAVDAGRDAKR